MPFFLSGETHGRADPGPVCQLQGGDDPQRQDGNVSGVCVCVCLCVCFCVNV